jgi:hypothetical protein
MFLPLYSDSVEEYVVQQGAVLLEKPVASRRGVQKLGSRFDRWAGWRVDTFALP